MRVGVIGSGVSGLTAAYLLSRRHEVTLFEKDGRLGGHANTVEVTARDGRTLPIDTGFIVHNDRTYPHLTRLFRELGVPTQNSDMSMSVRCDGCGLEYAGAKGLSGLLAAAANLGRPAYLRMLAEVKRFHRHGAAVVQDPGRERQTVADMLEEGGYSHYFRDHFLLPLIGAVWSSSQDLASDYPARHLVRFLQNHGMLSVFGSPQWRTVTGGSREYVRRIGEVLGDRAVTDAEVVGVARDRAGATVMAAPGLEHRFDAVVIATHSDQALKLLDDPTEQEQRVLGAWQYSRNETVLHTDASVLPRQPRARASWNYLSEGCGRDDDLVRITYDLSRLMRLAAPDRYLVTLNQAGLIDPATVLYRTVYDHPVYTLESLAAQRDLPALNGVMHTWYCGAYHGWGFHEDGYASGVRVARQLGVEP